MMIDVELIDEVENNVNNLRCTYWRNWWAPSVVHTWVQSVCIQTFLVTCWTFPDEDIMLKFSIPCAGAFFLLRSDFFKGALSPLTGGSWPWQHWRSTTHFHLCRVFLISAIKHKDTGASTVETAWRQIKKATFPPNTSFTLCHPHHLWHCDMPKFISRTDTQTNPF